MANRFQRAMSPPKSNVQFSEGQKSKGILDDYKEGQVVDTRELKSKSGTFDRIYVNDGVSIGTTSTTYPLTIVGSIYASGSHLMANNQSLSWGDSSTKITGNSTTDVMTLTAGANVVTVAECETAYDHSQDNTQAHSDYLLNNASDTFTGTWLTLNSSAAGASGMIINNQNLTGDPSIKFQLGGLTKAYIIIDDSDSDRFKILYGTGTGADKGLELYAGTITVTSNMTMELAELILDVGTVSVNDTTPKLTDYNIWKTANTGATTITNFDGGVEGNLYIIKAGDNNTTIADNADIVLSGQVDYEMATGDTITFMHENRVWYEIGRMQQVTGTYAEIYLADGSTAQTIATGAGYTKITAFATNGESNNCTADVANDKITITEVGKYKVNLTLNGAIDTANTQFDGAVFMNGSIQNNIKCYNEFIAANKNCSAHICGIIDVTTANWDVDFRVRHDDGGNVDITLANANLNVEKIGTT